VEYKLDAGQVYAAELAHAREVERLHRDYGEGYFPVLTPIPRPDPVDPNVQALDRVARRITDPPRRDVKRGSCSPGRSSTHIINSGNNGLGYLGLGIALGSIF
jgi:hypothetical protein